MSMCCVQHKELSTSGNITKQKVLELLDIGGYLKPATVLCDMVGEKSNLYHLGRLSPH